MNKYIICNVFCAPCFKTTRPILGMTVLLITLCNGISYINRIIEYICDRTIDLFSIPTRHQDLTIVLVHIFKVLSAINSTILTIL